MSAIALVPGLAAQPADAALYLPIGAQAPAIRGTPATGTLTPKALRAAASPTAAAAAATEPGRVCNTITFEGVGDLAAVPPISGINTPQWLGVIDVDAGGSGNIANEPSGETVAFWLGGASGARDIVLDNPASKVEFYYTSSVRVTVQAFDAVGKEIDNATSASNFNGGPGDPNGLFNHWTLLKVESQGNKIKRVRVIGISNQTAIDNLKVCTTVAVEAVEISQAIQQYQKLDDLKASLESDREPPVPIIAGKAAVLRVYLQKVDSATEVTVQLNGAVTQKKTLSLQPQCSPEDQRRQKSGCASLDFYFVPPSGNFDVTLDVLDSSGNTVESHALPLKSRTTDALLLKAVSVCDAKDASGNWLCEPAAGLAGFAGLLRKLAPTKTVLVQTTTSVVRRDTATVPTFPADQSAWWSPTAKEVADLHGFFESVSDFLLGRHTLYYGMLRPALPGTIGGMAHDIPSRGAISRSSAIRLGVETVNEVVAHEVGHTLSLRHTNTSVPAAAGSPPGCYSLAQDPGTDWPFANNRIQSAARLEVGFDVAARAVVLPETTFETMSYCTPRWVSPFSYKKMIDQLGGGSVSSSSALPVATGTKPLALARTTPVVPMALRVAGATATQGVAQATATGPVAWVVSGVIDSVGVRFDPLFDDAGAALPGTGDGSYRMELRDAAGNVLALRRFTPSAAHSESPGGEVQGPPRFFEFLPVVAGAARIVVLSPAGAPLGQLVLSGQKPAISDLWPAGGTVGGSRQISWVVTDADSAGHAAKLFYSADDGATWAQIGQLSDGQAALTVDFSTLPGSKPASRLMVSVSDGINSASAVSAPFMVARKAPGLIRILAPEENAALLPGTLLSLEGMAYDTDDGLLDGASVTWSSSQGGALGQGAALLTDRLARGTQLLTMTATDSDGNRVSAYRTVRVAGQPPTMDLTVSGADKLPTTCVEVTVDARADSGGVGLKQAEYSLNGGQTWSTIPLARLPFKFVVPGSGFFHVITRALDEAGQSVARDARFIVNSPCEQGGTPRLSGTLFDQVSAAPGVRYVDLTITNSGQGLADGIRITGVTARVIGGTGSVALDSSRTTLPLSLPRLLIGQSTTVRLYLNVAPGVTRFSLSESGSLLDKFGRTLSFSAAQSVIVK